MKTYAAITVQDEAKRLYAYIVPINESDNALSKLDIKGILHANIYTTKKKAAEVVEHWNECYRHNGTYMFPYPLF